MQDETDEHSRNIHMLQPSFRSQAALSETEDFTALDANMAMYRLSTCLEWLQQSELLLHSKVPC
jgi:hypothetical protein